MHQYPEHSAFLYPVPKSFALAQIGAVSKRTYTKYRCLFRQSQSDRSPSIHSLQSVLLSYAVFFLASLCFSFFSFGIDVIGFRLSLLHCVSYPSHYLHPSSSLQDMLFVSHHLFLVEIACRFSLFAFRASCSLPVAIVTLLLRPLSVFCLYPHPVTPRSMIWSPRLRRGPLPFPISLLNPYNFRYGRLTTIYPPLLVDFTLRCGPILRVPHQELFGPCSLRLSIADLTRGLGIQSSRSHVLNYVITLSTMYVGAACQLLTLHEYLIPSSSGCLVRFDDGGILPHPICMISLLVLGDSNLPSTSVHRHLSTAVYNPMADPISHIYMHE